MPNRQKNYIEIETPEKNFTKQTGQYGTTKYTEKSSLHSTIYIHQNKWQKPTMPKKTIKAATQYRLNQELKFIHVIRKRNERLYRIHLECASTWHNSWHFIRASVDKKIQQRLESHYNHRNKKLDNLQDKQWWKTKARHIYQE